MTPAERAVYQAKRVAQTPRTFRNWPTLLRQMVGEKVGGGTSALEFDTRSGVRLSCPNLPGARLPMYEQFADDCYRRDWVIGSERPLYVLDVGSHVGAFATNIASAAPHAHVECYEPSPDSARYLRENVARNGLDGRVRVHETALAGEAGTALLDDNRGGSVHNGLVRDDHRLVAGDDAWGERGVLSVATTTFDKAVADAPAPFTVVKMDCEGGEYELVYASSPGNWASVQRVVMEYHPVPGQSWDELRTWLEGVGLRVVRHESTSPGLGTAWLARADDGEVLSPRDQIRLEAREWRDVVEQLLGPDAELVSVSRYFCDSRVYRRGNRIAKIRRLDSSPDAYRWLAHEAEALRLLGRNVTVGTSGPWEYSLQDEQPGTPFSNHLFDQQDNAFTLRERMQVLRKVLRPLRDMHRRGIAHGDLRPENLLVDDRGETTVHLVDFDMASRGSRLIVSYRDWIGLGSGYKSRHPFWKLALFTLSPKTQTLGRRVQHAVRRPHPDATTDREPEEIRALRRAWQIAQGSAANARGQGLAYYSLSYRGALLKGERAWQLRWEALSRAVSFEGKSFVELGCNMGLLASYASLEGATDVIGVDHDPDVVEAARVVAGAFGSGAKFDVVDLMGADDWESRLGGREMVSALSVVHWLPDPERVLRFLGRHREVLYEGHDSLETETARLRDLGFDRVDVVMTTERNRHLLHAVRTRDS